MLDVMALSFMKWNGLTAAKQFVDPGSSVLEAVRASPFCGLLMSVVFPPAIGFALALALNQNVPGRSPLRALFYMPGIIAPIAVATMWRWMYDPFFGLFNATLTGLGLQSLIQDWLGDHNVALYSMFIAYVWQTVGFSLVLFLAGLQNISRGVRIDGAGRSVPLRDAAGAAARDHDCPHSVDHQFSESLRHRLRHDRRRTGAIDADARAVGLHPGDATRRLRARRGDLSRSARDHDRNRHPVSALDPRATRRAAVNAFAGPFRQPGLDRIDPVLVILWPALIVVAVVWIAPFVFIVFTSFKANSTVMGSSAFAPPMSIE